MFGKGLCTAKIINDFQPILPQDIFYRRYGGCRGGGGGGG